MTTDTLTLAERITSILEAEGFTAWARTSSGRNPEFLVADGVGATVSLSWEAGEHARRQMLRKYQVQLGASGMRVDNRGSYLYVHDPEEAQR